MKRSLVVLGCAVLAAVNANARPHVHGALQLDVAVEPRRITLQLTSPLEALIGFERAPRTPTERERVDAAIARLKAANALFKIDPAANCGTGQVKLDSAPLGLGRARAALGLGRAAPGGAGDGHADLEASFEFECRDATSAGYIDVGLFEAFTGMQRIDVQVVTSKGQFKRTLRRPARRLLLAR